MNCMTSAARLALGAGFVIAGMLLAANVPAGDVSGAEPVTASAAPGDGPVNPAEAQLGSTSAWQYDYPDPAVEAEHRDRWGIRIMGLRTSGGGYLLDFRYKVLDGDKAKYVLDRRHHPYLEVEKNHAKLDVPSGPTIGAMRQNTQFPKVGSNYFVLFRNPAQIVKKGDMVTVVIGDFKAEHIVVQ